MNDERREFVAGDAEDGQRLDRCLAGRWNDLSRSRLSRLIRDGRILVDGHAVRPSLPVAAGSRIVGQIPPPEDNTLEAEAIPLRIVHEDASLIVLDKPAGLVVHPGAGVREGTLAAALLHHDPHLAGVGGAGRCGLVHRLDRGTTGLMVVAKTAEVHRALSEQFRERKVEKIYDALVWGRPRQPEGEIELPIARDPRRRQRMTTRVPGGRPARSRYHVRGEVPGFALLAVRIYTGRTHQVRVHLSAIGHPLVGDATYGGDRARSVVDPRRRKAVREFDRPALHARRLAFSHPVDGERLAFVADWPPDLDRLWSALGGER